MAQALPSETEQKLRQISAELRIDWSQHIGYPCTLVIEPWDSGLSATTVIDEEPSTLALPDIGDWLLISGDPLLAEWRRSIPELVLHASTQLPDLRVMALHVARRDSTAMDLLISNPLLLWYLLDSQQAINTAMLARKQRDLLQLLGLFGSRQQLKVIRKMSKLSLTRKDALALRDRLEDPSFLNYISHIREPTVAAIHVTAAYPWMTSCKARRLINALADRGFKRIFDDTLGMLDDIAPLKQCGEAESIHRLHDRLVDQLNSNADLRLLLRDKRGNVLELQPPPLIGSDAIVPLTSQRDVIIEGKRMHHCIASYLKRIIEGRYYVYRFVGGPQLTIGLLKRKGQWILDEVRGRRNAMPPDDALLKIEHWLRSARQ